MGARTELRRSSHAETLQQRRGAMRAAHRRTAAVDHGRGVMGMPRLHLEKETMAPLLRAWRTARQFGAPGARWNAGGLASSWAGFCRGDQAYRADEHWPRPIAWTMAGVPGTKAMRRDDYFVTGNHGRRYCHLAAAIERRHAYPVLLLAVVRDAGRPIDLVAGEHVEIGIRIYVDVRWLDGGLQPSTSTGCRGLWAADPSLISTTIAIRHHRVSAI